MGFWTTFWISNSLFLWVQSQFFNTELLAFNPIHLIYYVRFGRLQIILPTEITNSWRYIRFQVFRSLEPHICMHFVKCILIPKIFVFLFPCMMTNEIDYLKCDSSCFPCYVDALQLIFHIQKSFSNKIITLLFPFSRNCIFSVYKN